MPDSVTDHSGKTVILTDEYWQHIKFRHPEIGNDRSLLMRIVKDPDEIHRDKRGGVHAMKRFDENHFTVVIYEFEGSTGFIRTAYLISNKRKSRRYGSL